MPFWRFSPQLRVHVYYVFLNTIAIFVIALLFTGKIITIIMIVIINKFCRQICHIYINLFNISIYKGVGVVQGQLICCFAVKINTMELLYYSDIILGHNRTFQNGPVKV